MTLNFFYVDGKMELSYYGANTIIEWVNQTTDRPRP